ncbi:phage major capsid protein [Herbaspirillum huttiense]|uniref:phage major capsid protein n=1 Tax=Herbaspirillum huttiense TaxID=863372 RepID=UPI0038193671
MMQQSNIITRRRGIMGVRADTGSLPPELRQSVEAMNKAFSDFKAEHTKQLDDIRKGLPSADQTAKVEAISASMDKLQKEVAEAHTKIAASQMSGGEKKLRDAEYTGAFQSHMRSGDIQAALSKGSAEDGGYTTPVEWDRTITDKLVLISPIRAIASVMSTSKAGFSKLFNVHGTGSGWVGETDARPETNSSKLKSLTFSHGEIYANPSATQQLLDDSEIDIEKWLASEVETEFAKQEGAAFVSGDGNKKPMGLLTYVTGGANATVHPMGAIALVNSGAAATLTSDGILDLIYSLPSAFAGNAQFIMNRNTQGAVRKLKDGQGNYLWQPSYVAGQPATLNGYPLIEVPDMPNVAANAVPIMFGDFKQGYQIIDRIGIRVLRDPYTNKPYVQFYTTKRVGGGLLNPEPLKGLKVSA